MRTRKKKYYDYGLTNRDVNNVFRFLGGMTAEQGEDVYSVLTDNMPEYMANLIYRALSEKKGYYCLANEEEMFCLKEDFYGYRRKAIALINEYLRSNNNGKKVHTGRA